MNDPLGDGAPLSAEVGAAPLTGRVLGSARSSFAVAEWTDPGGEPDPPRFVAPFHVHEQDDEAWYVLEGTLRFRLGDRELDVAAGSAILVPRGTAHTFWNPHRERARYLIVMTPNILGLIEDIHALADRDAGAMRAVFARHDSRLVEPRSRDDDDG
ncbi:MAG TPA: cupin domain-containing protein [Thermomicrobiales bacterium]|jgi:mannose-6-phosphate isomerase-like protein (cupin superfamily)